MRLITSVLAVTVLAAVIAPSALALRFTDDSYFTPTGVVGQPYSHWFKGDGGCGPGLPYQFRVLGGSLPPGLSLAKSGLLSGMPTQAGSYSFWVELSDQDPPEADWCRPEQAEREFTVTIQGAAPPPPPALPPLVIEQSTLPVAVVGTGYSTTLTAAGGGSQSWSLAGGSPPPGIALAANGTLAGTPAAEGTFTFTARVADGGSRSASEQFALVVRRALTLSASQSVRLAEEKIPMRALTFAAGGGLAPYTWSVEGNLPTGVQLNAATGAISGTPDYRGLYAVTVRLNDAEGRSATTRVQIRVVRPIAIVKPRIGVLRRGAGTTFRFATIGGAGKLRWKIERGRLPVGMRLNVNGVLVGTPKQRGVFRVVVRVTDGFQAVARRYTLFSVR